MNRTKLYLVAKILLTGFMVAAVSRYFFMYEATAEEIMSLGYPAQIIIPLGILKLLGLLAIWKTINHELTISAYAGFLFNFIFATIARAYTADPKLVASLVCILLLWGSYTGYRSNRVKVVTD